MILCAGECLIDMVPQPDGSLRPLAGGSVYNTAVALGRLGAEVSYLWPISRDGFGEQLLAPLTEANVDTSLCPRTDRLTTLAVVSLTNGDARYSFYDQGSAGRMFAEIDLPALPQGLSALFIGGISLVPDPCGATIETLAQRAVAAGVPVMLDPNIRPFFVVDECAYRERLDRLFALASIIKLSTEDREWLWPDQPPQDAAKALLQKGAKLVVLTSGADGATAFTAEGQINVPAQRVTVADTIGAGDTFNAGLLDALARSDTLRQPDAATLRQALQHAAKVAAVTVSRHGANPPWRAELS